MGSSRICDCNGTGFQGFQGASCEVDIDECASEVCDSLTVCTNTPGSFSCGDCPAGYTGTGASGCSDIDECLTNNGGCDPLTDCTNTPGGRTCGACPAGYSGTGATGCKNIDDCSPNPCRNGGMCVDGVASFTCSCVAPWTGSNCSSATLTVDATAYGYYSSFQGLMTGGNTTTGTIGADWEYRSFFVFHIPSFTGTVDTVTLRLEHESYDSGNASESFIVYDVSTPIAKLVDFSAPQMEVFDDLGSGTQYGTFSLSESTVNTVRPILLTGAVTAISNGRGSDFAVGIRSLGVTGSETSAEYARFSAGEEPRVHQLQIVVVP